MTSIRTRAPAGVGLAVALALAVGVPAGASGLPGAGQAAAVGLQAAGPSCADPATSAPSGPATVSAAPSAFGRVLVIGSGAYTGCSLYLLTSDRLRGLSSGAVPFACSDNANPIGLPCDSVLWPALLTKGAPIAGPGVDPQLLGTVTRGDLPGLPAVQQVTYAGQPLYRFFLDEVPGETEGANLFDPVTSPTGIWYLVDPRRGRPAPGAARLQLETAPLGGTGAQRTVLAAVMNPDFSVFSNASFPVYTLTADRAGTAREETSQRTACDGICAAVPWPPLLTSAWPEAGAGVGAQALGVIVRSDGTHQVTYMNRPLYLFWQDAYIPGIAGTKGIYGAGASTPWGEFDTIPSH